MTKDHRGLDDIARADRIACNGFLDYYAILWRLATELDVPVVDLTLVFQTATHDGKELFLDAAHPNAEAQRLIAEAAWRVLSQIPGQ
jgi:lysophospholipase L1-like esterase